MTDDKLITTKELAEFLGCSEYTIVQYRAKGTGPKFLRLGRLIRYRIPDLEQWLTTKITE